jgi:two-component system OmpR family response regulator
LLRRGLTYEGFRVSAAGDGPSGLAIARDDPPDLVILDWMLPGLDGLEVCKRLRAAGPVPIIMLTAKESVPDRVAGLNAGADDYLTKPFNPRELVARVKAMLRRTGAPVDAGEEAPLRRGGLLLDLQRHKCFWNDKEVVLTVTEFGLLRSLMGLPGKVYSRGELVDRAYGLGHAITDRTIDSHIRRIRRKFGDLGGDPVETVYGVGYRLKE